MRKYEKESACEAEKGEGSSGNLPAFPDVSSAYADTRERGTVLRVNGHVDNSRHRINEEKALKELGCSVCCLYAGRGIVVSISIRTLMA